MKNKKDCSVTRKLSAWMAVPVFLWATITPSILRAQHGQWHVADSDPAHDNAQNVEVKLSTDSVGSNFKFLWKLKLGTSAQPQSFNELMFTPGMITSHGFKDIGLWADSNTIYAIDYALGSLFWKKSYPTTQASGGCPGQSLQILMEAPRVVRFGVKSQRPATPPPPPPPPPDAADRWIGAPSPGGGFGLKGIYVVTGDGYLHEQIMATGLDYAPAEKFISGASGTISALNMNEKVLYAETSAGCGKAPNAVWSMNLNTAEKSVASFETGKIKLMDLTGPAIGPDGTVYVQTGSGTGDYADGVIALTAKDLKVKDWYSAPGEKLSASPIVVNYKGKEVIAAAGGGGSVVLLDGESLGGKDHLTALASTGTIAGAPDAGAWESLASWTDKSGTVWLFVSIAGPAKNTKEFGSTNGDAPHGSILAFRIEDKDGQTMMTPVWASRDLLKPAAPAIANGVVFALAGGDTSKHAVLYALDATTGKQLYSSGSEVTGYANESGISVGDGHVFFATHDNMLYSFGIPMEH
jgi:hypothetical protein